MYIMKSEIILYIAIAIIIIVSLVGFYKTRMNSIERFDQDGVEFLPVGETKYDLRGERLTRIPVGDYYVRPDRQIKLSGTDGFTWDANMSPKDQDFPYSDKCVKVECPKYSTAYDGYGEDASIVYDREDVCWKCDRGCFDKSVPMPSTA